MVARDESYAQLLQLAVHELRNPANVVSGYLRMLQQEHGLDTRQRKIVEEAAKSSQQLVALINELSEIQKLDAGFIELERHAFDVFSLIEELVADLRPSIQDEITVEVRGPESGAAMRGDQARLKRALSAIVRAVLRETPPGSRAVVDRRIESRDGLGAAVTIIAEASKLRDSYGAEQVPLDEGRGGLGLALPMARRIIAHHGGRVSSPAGSRAVAIVSLPLERGTEN
jgi:signal transduction histidine kinase